MYKPSFLGFSGISLNSYVYPSSSLSLLPLIKASSSSHFLNLDGNLYEVAGNEISQNTPQKEVIGSKWPVVKCLNCHPSRKDISWPAKVYMSPAHHHVSFLMSALSVAAVLFPLMYLFLNVFPAKVDL